MSWIIAISDRLSEVAPARRWLSGRVPHSNVSSQQPRNGEIMNQAASPTALTIAEKQAH